MELTRDVPATASDADVMAELDALAEQFGTEHGPDYRTELVNLPGGAGVRLVVTDEPVPAE